MRDTYTFPNNNAGREYRTNIGLGYALCGIEYREYEETVQVGKLTFTLLKLEVTGKRPGEGKIAKAMKEKKS